MKKLHEKQFIDRQEDKDDKRKHVMMLSKKGRACMDKAFQQIESMLMNSLSSSDQNQMDDIVQALRLLNQTIFKKWSNEKSMSVSLMQMMFEHISKEMLKDT
ncbi:hypothetical protein RE735_06390 [Bacillus aerius]|uniref:hypothetical protein n=1 Tax=Bacillus aerius TaxID=293388 RepID=UPI002814BB8E|nr:hypothetical protein [Bacillus aerius]WMT30156.1 hypothetical protein RE735_06390 [Bacillus aerius]